MIDTVSRRRIALLVIASSIAAGSIGGQQDTALGQGEARPVASIAQPIRDFGRVAKGEKVSHEFVIENTGSADLVLHEARPSCGCTVAEFDRRIPPGRRGTVRAVVDTASFSGPIAKGITVFTNDPEQAEIRLTLKADVRPIVVVEPGYARHVQTVGQQPIARAQLLWSDHPGFEVRSVSSPFEYLQASFRRATAEERVADGPEVQWRVETVLAEDAPIGPITGRLIVHTNHPRQKEVTVAVSGIVNPVIGVVPPRADFGTFAADELRRAAILLRNYSERPIQVTAVETDVPGLTTEFQALEEGRRYQVSLTLSPGLPEGDLAGRLRITTDDAEVPSLSVEVRGTVR